MGQFRDDRRRDILTFIRHYRRDHNGAGPTQAEIAIAVGLAPSTVTYHIGLLGRAGVVQRDHRGRLL